MKIEISLTPYDAVTILSFLLEFDYSTDARLQSLGEVVDRYESEVGKHITQEAMDDISAELRVNQLLGKAPESPNGTSA